MKEDSDLINGLRATVESKLERFRVYSRKEIDDVFARTVKSFSKDYPPEQLKASVAGARERLFEGMASIGDGLYVNGNSVYNDWLEFLKKKFLSFAPYSEEGIARVMNNYADKFQPKDNAKRELIRRELENSMSSLFESLWGKRIIIPQEEYDPKAPNYRYGSLGSFAHKKTAYYYIHKILFYLGTNGMAALLIAPFNLLKPLDKVAYKTRRGEQKTMAALKFLAEAYHFTITLVFLAIAIILMPFAFIEKLTLKPVKRLIEKVLFRTFVIMER